MRRDVEAPGGGALLRCDGQLVEPPGQLGLVNGKRLRAAARGEVERVGMAEGAAAGNGAAYALRARRQPQGDRRAERVAPDGEALLAAGIHYAEHITQHALDGVRRWLRLLVALALAAWVHRDRGEVAAEPLDIARLVPATARLGVPRQQHH